MNVVIIGLGYVGLPLAQEAVRAGVQVVDGCRLDVETGDVQAGPDRLGGQRQAHVAEPDDHHVHVDLRLLLAQTSRQLR